MKRTLLLALGVAAMSMVASATTFDFTSTLGSFSGTGCAADTQAGDTCAVGNVFTQTLDGITLTARAYSSSNGSTGDYAAARLYKSPGSTPYVGLGVCNANELSGGCSLDEGWVDNSGSYDYVLFTFSQAVDVTGMTLWTTNAGDNDMQWWFAALATDPNGQGSTSGTSSNTSNISFPGVNFTTNLLVGPRFNSNDNDGVKIQTLSVEKRTDINQVPEPGSMALLGSGLVGLGVLARRRRK